jgi:Icc-related predicted phosphoesterase
MKIVVISDTHGQHEQLGDLSGDVLIHCGDLCNGFSGDADDIQRLDAWFGRQQFARIFCVGGNHDFALERRVAGSAYELFRNATYLEDECAEFEGVRFYGAPWTPELAGWAFYLEKEDLRNKWSHIPEDVHVLITHTPPQGILDLNRHGRSCGCSELRDRVEKVQPALHCFGHVHASAGSTALNGTTYFNASMVDSRYRIARCPLIYEFGA